MPTSRPTPPTDAPPSLARRFELVESPYDVCGTTYRLIKPRSVDELISEEDFAIDERIPYWADCWPSSRVLAAHLAGERGSGLRMIELGCGIGLVSLVCAAGGFEALATDYYADALEFTAANAERNGLPNVDTRLVDWRALPEDLGRFELVTAADVLYEKPQIPLVAETIRRALAPGGRALVSDPGRRTAEVFVEQCERTGLVGRCVARVPTSDGETRLTVSIYEVRHR